MLLLELIAQADAEEGGRRRRPSLRLAQAQLQPRASAAAPPLPPPLLGGLALVTTRAVRAGEELLFDYRLPPGPARPPWYHDPPQQLQPQVGETGEPEGRGWADDYASLLRSMQKVAWGWLQAAAAWRRHEGGAEPQ